MTNNMPAGWKVSAVAKSTDGVLGTPSLPPSLKLHRPAGTNYEKARRMVYEHQSNCSIGIPEET